MSDGRRETVRPDPPQAEKARKEGNVARSTELNGILAFAAGLVALTMVAPLIAQATAAWLGAQAEGGGLALGRLAMIAGLAVVPIAAAGVAGATTGVLQMGGPLLIAPTFKLERLRPDEGFKRMFSVQSMVTAGKSLLAFAVAAVAVASVIGRLLGSGVAGSSEPGVFADAALFGVKMLLALLVVGGVFASSTSSSSVASGARSCAWISTSSSTR